MRIVLQRVSKASVWVEDEIVGNINRGICLLVGISVEDTPKDIDYMVRKILNCRIFPDETGPWKLNVVESELEILSVSQFTLYGVMNGTKPDFHRAMKSEKSKEFYEEFMRRLRTAYKTDKIQDGRFGLHTRVDVINDGPTTLIFESDKQKETP